MRTVFLAIAGCLLIEPSATDAQPPSFDRSGETVVLHYQEVIGALAADEPGPSVEVYGDGRVVVRYPSYMKQAGTHTVQLSAQELDALVERVVNEGLLPFDTDAAAEDLGAARAASAGAVRRDGSGGVLTHVSDPPTTVIEATLSPQPGQRSSRRVVRAQWTGLAHDALAHPQIESIRNLARAEEQMRALMHGAAGDASPGSEGLPPQP